MLRFVVDENFHNDILRGILREISDVDIVRAQDIQLARRDDPTLLEWAAHANRILLTHDIKTMPNFVRMRLEANQTMPGVIIVKRRATIGRAIQELVLVIELGTGEDFENRILYVPM